MATRAFSPKLFSFLRELAANNTREWFADARNYALYANAGGQYDDLAEYLKGR